MRCMTPSGIYREVPMRSVIFNHDYHVDEVRKSRARVLHRENAVYAGSFRECMTYCRKMGLQEVERTTK